MDWTVLTNEDDWQQLLLRSVDLPVLLYKHSSRCTLSSIVKYRLDDYPWASESEAWFLDVIQYRSLSQKIARELDVIHESPQVLIVKAGICEWDEDHLDIHSEEVETMLHSLVDRS